MGRSGTRHVIDGVEHLSWTAPRERGVLILGHMDTVWPVGTLERMPYRVDNGRASGPGTFDMNAGIVAAVAALERLRSVEGQVVAYVFAYDSDDDSADVLGQLPNVTVQEVPQPLLDLFFRIKE